MKKTQSLKLMLLGLMSLVSTGAWAQTYTAKDGVVYAKYDAKAEVVGVIESALPAWDTDGKQITIPDEVDGVKVTAFASGWTKAGWYQNGGEQPLPNPTGYQAVTDPATGITTYTNSQSGGSVSYTGYQTTAAADIEAPIYMLIRASQITEITCDDVKEFKVKTFCLGATSGITVIPENLFAMTTKVRTENPENAANQQAIADAQAIIDGYDVYYVTDGQYDGKQVYKHATQDKYFIVGDVQEQKDGEFCNQLYKLVYDANGQTVSMEETDSWVKVVGDDLKAYKQGDWTVVASAFSGNKYPKSVAGKQALYDAAVAAEAAAKQAYDDAKAALDLAIANKVYPNNSFSDAQKAKKAAAERLKAAIEAFQNHESWTSLQQRVSEKTGTNVSAVTAWFAAYTMANDTDNSLLQVNSQTWSPLRDEFIDAYIEFYGKNPEALENAYVIGYELTPYALSGASVGVNGTYVGNAAVLLEDVETGIVISGQGDQDAVNEMATQQGYYRIKALDGTLAKDYYVKINPAEQAEGAYYQLYEFKNPGGFTPMRNGDGENDPFVVVQFGEPKPYVYVPATGYEPAIDAADPVNDINAAIDAATPKTAEQLQAAVDAAEAAKDAAEEDWNDAKDALDAAKDALDAAKQDVADAKKNYEDNLYVNDYLYDKDKQNEVLENVNLYNGIITDIEDHAFANCVNAKFKFGSPALGDTDKFPATLKSIGEEAFLNTQFANLDLSQTEGIDDEAIGDNAFKNTPLVKMILNPTELSATEVKDIVRNQIKKEATVDVDYCGESKTLYGVNTTLTTVTLPAGSTAVIDGEFFGCTALSSIDIPAGVTAIGEEAFAYTAVPEFDLTALTGLATIGNKAFAYIPTLTAVKLAPEATVAALNAETFVGSCQLSEVKFNDAMTTLAKGLFATNALAALELCNTKVLYLPNLFLAGPGEREGDAEPNETLLSVCLPDGLLMIDEFALSSCKKLEEVEIPGSVFLMGDGVFYNDVALKKVTIMDSRMIGLPRNTFKQCTALEEVTFVTLETINPNPNGNNVTQTDFEENQTDAVFAELYKALTGSTYSQGSVIIIDQEVEEKVRELMAETNGLVEEYTRGQVFGDNIFFSIGHKPTVTVGYDSYNKLKGGSPVYAEAYSTLAIYQPEITINAANFAAGSYWKPFQSKYGTWIKAGGKQIVYSAYQDGHNIILYPAKIKNGYYKIAAYTGRNDAAAAAVIRSQDQTFSFEQKTNPEQKAQTTLDRDNQLLVLENEFAGNSNQNIYYLSCAGANVSFYQAIEGITLPEGFVAFRTEAEQGQGSRMNVIIVDENEATAIQGVKEYVDGVKSGAIFNLQGVRVSATQKGQMYIQGGKKFIQK